MSAQLPNAYPSAGEIIDGKYQIERMLGEGGMGAVAKAIHLLLRAPVALKFMNPQFVSFPGAVERFLNEGVASKAIKSEHVVQVSDVGKLPSGAPYLVMDCLEGRDLSELLAEQGNPGIEIERSVHFLAQILRGLQVAHAIGIIHRDMKPSNCFVVRHEGQADFVKILDFGISKVRQEGSASLTQTNSALGTPLYMSPEQARSPRDVDARSDIYSVGVIFYELLTGRTPFSSDSGEFTEILFKLFTADVPRIEGVRPDVPPALAEVVHKALARDVADRYQSVMEFAEALTPFASARTASTLDRIKHFQPESRSSIVPRPEGAPSSTFAFSALGQHTKQITATPAATDTRADPNEATAHTQISPPEFAEQAHGTQLLAQQPAARAAQHAAGAQASQPSRPSRPSRPAPAPNMANAPSTANQPAAARTNLAVARDTTDHDFQRGDAPKKRSPFVLALPAVALVAVVGGIAFGVKSMRSNDSLKPEPANGLVMTATPLAESGTLPSAQVTSVSSSATSATSATKPPSSAASPNDTSANGGARDAGVKSVTQAQPGPRPTGTPPPPPRPDNNAHPNVLNDEVVR